MKNAQKVFQINQLVLVTTKFEKSPTCFDKTVVFTLQHQDKWEIFSKFCGLFRKAEL